MSDIAKRNMNSENTGMFGVSGTGDTSGYGGLQKRKVQIGSTERPFGSYFDDVVDGLERAYPGFSDAVEQVVVDRGELTLLDGRSGSGGGGMDEPGGYDDRGGGEMSSAPRGGGATARPRKSDMDDDIPF